MEQATRYPVIVGTAGHIDHGKTTLVKALTGQDADRLPEEKQRGITIDLGFAHATLPSGQRVAFIDVPGHERFVRNMVAGVHGMDAVVMVVAADEGVMPQTTEHLDILRLLGVKTGLTVITKADLADEEMVELVRSLVDDAVAGTFLESKPVVVVDAVSGRGIDKLLAELDEMAVQVERRPATGHVRLPIDRVFTVKGFGTVVTGTLVAGQIAVEDPLELVPAGHAVRVRGIQVHNRSVDTALSGQRVAVNLAGIDRVEVARGDVLASSGILHGVSVAALHLELLKSSSAVVDHTRVHVHAGTAESLGRLYLYENRQLNPGETGFAEIRLETPLPLARRDRVLIRAYSPVVTIGGGVVLEIDVHHKKRESRLLERLMRLGAGNDADIMADNLKSQPAPIEVGALADRLGMMRDEAAQLIQQDPSFVMLEGHYVWHAESLEEWSGQVNRVISHYVSERPIKPGMPLDDLRRRVAAQWPSRVMRSALERQGVVIDREWLRLEPTPRPLSAEDQKMVADVYQTIAVAGLKPDPLEQVAQRLQIDALHFEDIVERLFLEGRLMRLEDGLAMSREAYEDGRRRVREAVAQNGPSSTSDLRDVLGVSRRLAVLILELLDREHVTRRVGDTRELMS